MNKNIQDFINIDTNKYISLKSIKMFYWSVSIIWLVFIVFGFVGKMLFPLIFAALWSFVYWTLVAVLQSQKITKTFELRFLVNGIAGFMMSALFWGLHTSVQIALSNQPHLKAAFFLWTLLAYIAFSVIMIALTVLGVHKGVYGKMKRKSLSKRVLLIDGFFAAILPFCGLIGMYTSKLLRSQADANIQEIVANICLVLLIFLPGLAHVNFVQYYYCKKYGITSNEDGETTSPLLEPTRRKHRKETKLVFTSKKQPSVSMKTLKIILILIAIPVALLVSVFIVFFVKGFISSF